MAYWRSSCTSRFCCPGDDRRDNPLYHCENCEYPSDEEWNEAVLLTKMVLLLLQPCGGGGCGCCGDGGEGSRAGPLRSKRRFSI